MLESVLRTVRPDDVPVCLPGRHCVDLVPAGGHLAHATVALTPDSPAIAAGCFILLGAALVLVALGLRLQWRGPGVRPWLVVVVAALLLVGFGITTAVDLWFGTVSEIYSNAFGELATPPPPSLFGAWPSVLAAGHAMEALAVGAIAVLVTVARIRRRRPAAG